MTPFSLDRHCRWMLLIFLLATPARVEATSTSAGHLAVREDRGRWRIHDVVNDVPRLADLRTSPAGATSIDVQEAHLVMGADSQLHIDQKSHQLTLDTGRVFLSTTAAWKVTAGDHTIWIDPESKVVVTITSPNDLRIELFDGGASFEKPGAETRRHHAPLSLSFDGSDWSQSVPENPEAWATSATGWTDVREPQGLGQLVVNDPQSGSATRMEIARCYVNVVLKPPVALVQLDQSFYNPASRQEEGTFVFNLPQGASISRFAMFVTHDELIEGELIERQRASNIYESIVRRRRDPAILEQIGDNLFRMRVFPIFAKDTKRILLDFTVPLVERSGRYHFDLPLISDLKPIWDFKLSGTIYPPTDPGSFVSRLSPQMEFKADEKGVVRFSSEQQHVHPPARLDIEYRQPGEPQPHLNRFVTNEGVFGPEEQYFVVSIPGDEVTLAQPQPCDLMIVADTSGSSRQMSLIKQSVRTILANLGPQDRFRLACADATLRPLNNGWQTPDPQVLGLVSAELDQQFSLGASRLAETLPQAAQVLSQQVEGRRRILVYVGDGQARGRFGEQTNWRWPLITQLTESGVSFSAISIGNDANGEQFLETVARRTGGTVFSVAGARDLEDLFAWTLAGCPTGRRVGDVTIENEADAETFVDPTYLDGESLYIYGRCKPRDNLKLAVTINGEQRDYEFNAMNSSLDDKAVFAGRLWAQRKLEALQATSPDPIYADRKAIVKLSQEWSLLSPYTAFLVLESEADYQRWNVDRQLRRRYWKPPEALAAIPLPLDDESTRSTAERPRRPVRTRPRRRISRAQFDRTMQAANAALKLDEPALALRRLLALRGAAHQYGADEYARLIAEAERRLQREQILDELGVRRRQYDRTAPLQLPNTDLFASLLGAGGISDDYLKRHPLIHTMLKRVTPPRPKMTLTEFVEFMRRKTGWNILMDEVALTDFGIPADEPLDLHGIEEMTIRNLLHHALVPVELTYISTPHLFTITTTEVAENTMSTQVYPVVDLIRTDQQLRPEMLSSPISDLERDFEQRTEAALDQTVSVDFGKQTLADFRDWLHSQLKTSVRMDEVAMTDVGISLDEPVRPLRLNNVPLRVVVDAVLREFELECQINRELVEITTTEVAEYNLQTRLYSAVGVVYEFPVELTNALQARQRQDWRWGGFGGGIGGGGFGGGIGGGGLGGAGGGFGGGGFTDGEAASGSTDTEAGMSRIEEPAATEETETEPAESESAAESSGETPTDNVPAEIDDSDLSIDDTTDMDLQWQSPGGTGSDMDDLSFILQNETEGPWEEIDGIGGTMEIYAPTMSIVVRQTPNVHREIEEQLKMLRALPVAGNRVRPASIPRITEDMAAGWDTGGLVSLLQQETEGPWEDIDGIGGSISPHMPSMSLMIRQTGKMHEEVDQLLAQLRREMVLNRVRIDQWNRGIRHIDSPRFGSQVILTAWPSLPMPDATGTQRELELLQARHVPPEFADHWRTTCGEETTEFHVRRSGSRLELLTDRVQLRSDDVRGAVRFPGLTRVEIDDWGETIRRTADSMLPWLPHVSNDELAALYNVELASESDKEVALRLRLSSDDRVAITATFDRTTGLPVGWEAFVGDSLLYRLKIDRTDGEVIVAVDADDREIERWELAKRDKQATIPPLKEHDPNDLVIDRRDRNGEFVQIHGALAAYDYRRAAELLEQTLKKQPQQPLLNFLLAWTCEHAGPSLPDARLREREALTVVVESTASDLLPLVRPENFRAIERLDLLTQLEKLPRENLSLETLDSLVGLWERENRFDQALEYLTDSLSRPGGATMRRRLWKVDLLLELGDRQSAKEEANRLSQGASAETLADVGDLFGRLGEPATGDTYFDKARELTASDRSAIAAICLRQAFWHQGASRWRRLLEAAERQPGKNPASNSPLLTILQEAGSPTDAEILGRMAEETNHPVFRTMLRIRQARLTADPNEAAQLCRELLQTGRVPADDEPWMLRRLIETDDAGFVINLLESRLHRGDTLGDPILPLFASAYEQTGQTTLAQRARSEIHEHPRRPQPSTGTGFF